ncbi:uncharacterized protein K452DRAFT_62640 [Aplosporella prunicola CBS 121167]|uniref:Uncharacterized protein n=1 Tax=Aplosporella prunicola CBS 121167 TaxID=1176127 RepID=A0A6A6B7Q4_9PEZI|nr:uncharacterized protein K452DRAFT_62640 [Aplosporella prunicola CBS 121167]KAF2139598.1 hypothetical protein K452DRAFT_62640 [Aplosporella prunicola CBS 121167]
MPIALLYIYGYGYMRMGTRNVHLCEVRVGVDVDVIRAGGRLRGSYDGWLAEWLVGWLVDGQEDA